LTITKNDFSNITYSKAINHHIISWNFFTHYHSLSFSIKVDNLSIFSN